jgi:hypothetical protein
MSDDPSSNPVARVMLGGLGDTRSQLRSAVTRLERADERAWTLEVALRDARRWHDEADERERPELARRVADLEPRAKAACEAAAQAKRAAQELHEQLAAEQRGR